MNRRRIVGLLVVIALITSFAVVVLFRSKPYTGHVVALSAVDKDTAVVLWEEDGDAKRTWIGRIDASGRLRWSRALPGEWLEYRLTASSEVVVVRASSRRGLPADADRTDTVMAFALDDGRRLWEREPPQSAVGELTSPHENFQEIVVGGRVIQNSDSSELFALDLATGAVAWRAYSPPLPPSAFAETVLTSHAIDDRVVLETRVGTWSLDVRTGSHTQIGRTHGFGCVLDDDYINLVTDLTGKQLALAAFRGGDPSEGRLIAKPFESVEFGEALGALREQYPGFDRARLKGCGRYGSRLVFLVTLVGRDPDLGLRNEKGSLAVIADPAGQVLHAIPLPLRPSSRAIGPRLTRFTPLVENDAYPRPSTLVMLDLEEGRIAWTDPEHAFIDDAVRRGDHWIISTASETSPSIFDGKTGRLAAAVSVRYSSNKLSAYSKVVVGDGRVWAVPTLSRVPFAEMPIAVLDANTLTPLYVRGLEVTDVTEMARAKLEAATQEERPSP